MKIKSLLLGSVAAVGLSTGAFAADPLGVLTALDICDDLGLSGLTISSDTNCLQITGEVKYTFEWGDYSDEGDAAGAEAFLGATEDGDVTVSVADHVNDWNSRVDAWIKFVATSNSDFGPARAVLKLKEVDQYKWNNGVGSDGSDSAGAFFDEAYVSVGDSTILIAGRASSIMEEKEDAPLNFLGLFNSSKVGDGVTWSTVAVDSDGDGDTESVDNYLAGGGHVIQLVSEIGNGVDVGIALENLNDSDENQAGTLVGVVKYAGDGIAAHVTAVAGGILDGRVENWGVHAGFAGSFDMVKVVAAIAADDTGYYNALASASVGFDIITLAVSGEVAADREPGTEDLTGDTDVGFGASLGAAVTDGVTIDLGGRWYSDAYSDEHFWQAAVRLTAAVTETVTLTGELGAYGNELGNDANTIYGAAEAGWKPGTDFSSSLRGEVYGNGAYKTKFTAKKTFE